MSITIKALNIEKSPTQNTNNTFDTDVFKFLCNKGNTTCEVRSERSLEDIQIEDANLVFVVVVRTSTTNEVLVLPDLNVSDRLQFYTRVSPKLEHAVLFEDACVLSCKEVLLRSIKQLYARTDIIVPKTAISALGVRVFDDAVCVGLTIIVSPEIKGYFAERFEHISNLKPITELDKVVKNSLCLVNLDKEVSSNE